MEAAKEGEAFGAWVDLRMLSVLDYLGNGAPLPFMLPLLLAVAPLVMLWLSSTSSGRFMEIQPISPILSHSYKMWFGGKILPLKTKNIKKIICESLVLLRLAL